ncbi:hypothetical protein RHMOL_Rhmol04G0338000 [Rhododendron molle]|uniref:Uncharacterized protein n=1 Tax=Rhododendron molle TaxID=49168 RepID=A0ACC0P9M5_RHOML|nr:hypothetical protein RHMOL_Rhmol04G0338000 [Rhododendron molle]
MMQWINAVEVVRMGTRGMTTTVGAESGGIEFGSVMFFVYAGLSCLLVLFAGIMSGLTLGLMSLGLVELEILQRSGTATEKKQAAAILPVVQKQHQLLVTLLLCNACAMEALPIYLDKLFNQYVAIVLSVTFVLAFGEVIPQSICTRYGLAVGANFVWLVRILMIVCYPIAYPIGKILDCVLGHNDALFRRAQLKALVSIHSQEAGKGGELTHDETTIISGALDLTEKTAEEAMTPIESTFSLDVNSKLDWVPADMPLYDILNEFQKGSSHMAAVVRTKGKSKITPAGVGEGKTEDDKFASGESQLTTALLLKQDEKPKNFVIDMEKSSRPSTNTRQTSSQHVDTINGLPQLSEDIEDGEVVGIITLEDVFEELLQEEIVDETDEFVDVHKRIRVAAAAVASSMARAPSLRRLTGHKGAVNEFFWILSFFFNYMYLVHCFIIARQSSFVLYRKGTVAILSKDKLQRSRRRKTQQGYKENDVSLHAKVR